MNVSTSASTSLKEYLKRYESNNEEEKRKKKKKKKKCKPVATSVLVVDEDPAWQKPVRPEEESDESAEEPQVEEDIEVKRIKRLEQLRSRQPYHAISEDGSGWVPVTDFPKSSNSNESNFGMSPPRQQYGNINNSPTDHQAIPSECDGEGADLSPPRQRQRRYHSPSLESETNPRGPSVCNTDIPPCHRPRPWKSSSSAGSRDMQDAFPGPDLSPPRKSRKVFQSPKSNLSPQKSNHQSPGRSHMSPVADLSPPRRSHKESTGRSHMSPVADLSPPRRSQKESFSLKDKPGYGLIVHRDSKKQNSKKETDDWLRFKKMDPSISGQVTVPAFRRKKTGEQLSKDEILKLQKKDEEKLEWGKGLAQKREAEERLAELEIEKNKPFARSRDDPDLDKMLRERINWGDPMAHLIKKKPSGSVLRDLGSGEKMMESGFNIPQEIPSHSWMKRGVDAAPNRYGIKPGRHWDGVDRSTGFEKEMFKRMNEKQATEREAYLWSVSDM